MAAGVGLYVASILLFFKSLRVKSLSVLLVSLFLKLSYITGLFSGKETATTGHLDHGGRWCWLHTIPSDVLGQVY